MWLSFAFLSAVLLGFYDSCKKQALGGNAVIPVLFLNTLFCSLIFVPFIVLSYCSPVLEDSIFKVADYGGWAVQKWILLKSVFVLSSWTLGYYGMKHLPLTIVGPINATRPVLVLHGSPGGHDQGSLMADFLVRAGHRAIIPSRPGYLGSELTPDGRPLDAAARFHLGNGARVERLNWAADPSAKGLKQSFGLMVNYLYDLKRIDKHRDLLAQAKVPVSGDIEDLCRP